MPQPISESFLCQNEEVLKKSVKDIERDGYCILDDVVPAGDIRELSMQMDERFIKTPHCDGPFYGSGTKRFGTLLSRYPSTQNLVCHQRILAIVDHILSRHCDRFQLNLTQAVEIHPGQRAQYPHRDQDMWDGEKGNVEYLINVMWPLSDFTADNGATLIWPGSHRRQSDESHSEEGAIAAEMKPGQALVFLGSTLHGGGNNITQHPRRGIIVSYSLGWLKPYEAMFLVYPPDVAKKFDPELAALVGYQQHRPNLGNVEGQCPSRLLDGTLPQFAGARDELRPDQLELATQFLDTQNAA